MASKACFNFVDKTSNENICSICANILVEPVLTECCGQSFCDECLKKWLEREKSCPHCQTENFIFIKDLRTKRMINSSKIYCPNHSKGCEEITTVGECSTHLETCLFEEVPCTNDCGISVIRKELQYHTANECPKSKVNCQYCNEEGVKEDITSKSHTDKCPSLPLDCPNNCGHDKIQRKDLSDHQKECPLEPVKCPFFEAGCEQEMPRKELAAHKASNTENHLELTMITSVSTQRQLQTMTLTAKAAKEELEEATQEYKLAQKKLDEITQNAEAIQSKLEEAKTTQEQLRATRNEMKQLSLKYNGLVMCVTKHLLVNPNSITDISNIKTALEAMTTMLKKSKQYCLPLVSTAEGIKRSPTFFVQPGYKMFVADAVYLLKGEHDEKLEWPMLKMNIELKMMDNHCLSTVMICSQCGYTGNKLEGDQEKEKIERIIYTNPTQAASMQIPDSVLITVMPHNCITY